MFFRNLLKKIALRREDAIGLDIGSGSIKMADVLLRNGKPFLNRMTTMEVPAGAVEDGAIADEELLANALRNMASKNGLSGERVAVAIGGRSLFIREVAFPRMSASELGQAIRWDLDKYVPFAPDQLYFDFSVIGAGATEMELRILLVAAPKDAIDTVVRVFDKSGLKLVAIDIEPLAVLRTLPEATNCMLMDIGAANSQMTLFLNNSPVFTRSIPIGGNQFTATVMENMSMPREEAEQFKLKGLRPLGIDAEMADAYASDIIKTQITRLVGDLAGEMRRTLEFYQVQNRNVKISRMYITGGGARTENLSEQLSQMVELPVFIHDPLLGISAAASFNQGYLREMGPRMTVAVGLAMRGINSAY